MQASIMTNTSIKLAGGTSHADALALSREMNTSPEFVAGMTKEQGQTNFCNLCPQHNAAGDKTFHPLRYTRIHAPYARRKF